MITALVPMKGKSERVPGKNLRPLAGRPLCWYVLTTLHAQPAVTRIVVDTDSEEIAETVRGFRLGDIVTVLDRPQHLRGDHVNGNPLTEWEMSQVEGEHFLQTHVTNPFLSAATVERAIEAYRDHSGGNCTHDSLMAITRHRSHFYRADGEPVNHDPRVVQRTQDLAPVLEDNHCLYLFSRTSFAATGSRIGERPYMFPVPRWEAVDIDWPEDFEAAEALMAARMAVPA